MVVQLAQTLLTLRQNRRAIASTALGAEVTALETAIKILQDNLAQTTSYYQEEIGRLRRQIAHLEGVISEMRGEHAVC